MTLRKHLAGAAMAASLLGSGLTAASAQTFNVTASVTGAAPSFTYSYTLTPTAGSLGFVLFNFADSTVTPGAVPAGFLAATSSPTTGVFTFIANPATNPTGVTAASLFTFTSPDASSAGETGIQNASFTPGSPGVFSAPLQVGPTPAPEPGSLVSMAVLGTCLGLGIVARKRKALSA